MKKTWNTNKTLPELKRDIIYITYDGRVFTDYLVERECGIRFQCSSSIDWFDVKLWQYVGVMFAEELGLYVEKEKK